MSATDAPSRRHRPDSRARPGARVDARVPLDLHHRLAAVADQQALGVLHYDHDYDTIAAHTPLTFRSVWIAPRGTLEG